MIEYSCLIIDDDIWMQRILSKTFSSYGFKVSYLASNGFEGIGKAVEYQPNIIVLDILMPDLSGHLTLKVLKSIKVTKEIPVVMVSALSDLENLGKAVKSGTAGFISKPFTRATVYEKLLDIYGKEKLDLIARGKPLIDSNLGYISEDRFSNSDDMIDFSGLGGGKRKESYIPQYADFDSDSIDFDGSSAPKPVSVSTDVLSSKYVEEEKKSLDSIKSLLLKTRKGESE